ncbi:nucleolar autoantigen-like protein, putative [Trichomonas vaginalis G3]|uniref:Nucleolar autoantigen-like protein, putative n=1 Tax=Trichomonas vaginalis (strain ATCC PRA-98 / G3) TaxID=412133 RepID=A2DPV1_TRIV3|nr:U1 snRNA 3'-end processing [Trichomonas vaginalis G3]EAY17547.1 nucleolar autoantigen-like protein, putative [Trichomonas vaginalis G3]KAI5520591.1 U1 snRNA 3'-end processing [Trichomonas vaginalis G3]|eukprot:XP_001329682.1 nucleolar autoantigen-like protein [Trichomonas vaginalis G3]
MEGNAPFFVSKNEIRSTREMLSNGLRPDGRDPNEPRRLTVDFSDGAAIVKLGSTIVSCRVIKNQVLADENHPNQGFFSIGLSSTHKIDSYFRAETLNAVRDMFKMNNALDLESLVIQIGKLVWELKCEIVILENDGGLFEAMTLAVGCGLLATKLPSTRGDRSLTLHHLPIPITFALIDQRTRFVDPTVLEALACDGFLTICANAQGEICSIRKNGGVTLPSTVMDNCIDIAVDLSKKWHLDIMNCMGDKAPPLLKAIVSYDNKPPEPPKPSETVEQEVIKEMRKENPEVKQESEHEQEENDDDDVSGMIGVFNF